MVIENHALLCLHVNFDVYRIFYIHSILYLVSNNDLYSHNVDKQRLVGLDTL